MQYLVTHIDQDNWVDLFTQQFRSHALLVLYSCIHSAARTSATKLLLKPDGIAWYQDQNEIDHLDTLVPYIKYVDLLREALDKDPILNMSMYVGSETDGVATIFFKEVNIQKL